MLFQSEIAVHLNDNDFFHINYYRRGFIDTLHITITFCEKHQFGKITKIQANNLQFCIVINKNQILSDCLKHIN